MKSNDSVNDLENSTENGIPAAETNSEKEIREEQKVEEVDPVTRLEAELADARDKYLRLYSDFDNYKKRISRDRIEQSKMAGYDIFLMFLPVIDDLERALKSSEDSKENSAIAEGIKLIYTKLMNAASSKGLKAMNAVGNNFDADLHEAISNVKTDSDELKGKVIDEVEKGYFLNDKVLRHAKVVVGI